jgi:hypothetical protein
MSTSPRRWFQFSLRTMFVVVTLVSIPLAWVGYSLNWKRQRQEALRTHAVFVDPYSAEFTQAPTGLWLFEDHGWKVLMLIDNVREQEMRRLFPESEFVVLTDTTLTLPGS